MSTKGMGQGKPRTAGMGLAYKRKWMDFLLQVAYQLPKGERSSVYGWALIPARLVWGKPGVFARGRLRPLWECAL